MLNPLFSAADSKSKISDIIVGVAININAKHVGFVYTINDDYKFLHLATHDCLLDESFPYHKKYFCSAIDLSPIELMALAGLISTVQETAKFVPYGIDYHSSHAAIQPDGSIIPLPLGKGFTCASFVTAIMNVFGYDCVAIDTWPDNREDDVEFQKWLVTYALPGNAPDNHIAALEKDIGTKRLRPSEVAGVCTKSLWPMDFQDAEKLAQEVIACLN